MKYKCRWTARNTALANNAKKILVNPWKMLSYDVKLNNFNLPTTSFLL